ncbi:MAG: hypothetical protein RE471_07740 [Ferroplasma sp.]|uniref:hypothetical protein n=1 Tax=Ferroplasma sp. TaxID=2591003 RepID=UPI0028158438|nr:hypothetical protein [Ferroplasma sp.]WMT50858.1 MAG: hypothetical protein RE471_07740 [Ferroplasma sp.]
MEMIKSMRVIHPDPAVLLIRLRRTHILYSRIERWKRKCLTPISGECVFSFASFFSRWPFSIPHLSRYISAISLTLSSFTFIAV